MIKTNHKYFNELGKNFDEFMSDYDVQQRKSLVFKHLLKKITLEGKKILEVGCGTGRFSMEIERMGGFLTALDIGQNLVQKVAIEVSCDGAVGDACLLPFSDNAFDIIISSECIEHTLYPKRAIKEMCRVCRPGGNVCITTPNKLWYPLLLFAQWAGARKFSGIENWIWPFQILRIFKDMNMIDIQVRGCHLLPFQLKFIHPILCRIDQLGTYLFPFMINFGIIGRKNY